MRVHKRANLGAALATVLVAALAVLTPTPSTGATLSPWKLRMVERFDTYKTYRWNAWDNVARSNEAALLLPRNVTVENGNLRIQAKREALGGRLYTSGALDTYGKLELPNYFKVQVRAKLPQEAGMWPAPVWFRPATDGGEGHEIDLVESIGREAENGRARIHHTVHGVYGTGQRKGTSVPFSRFGDPSGTRWHTYEIVKTRGRIVMWVDGSRTAVFTPGNTPWFRSSFEAGRRWALRVNLQVGGGWAGLPDHRTDWRPRRTSMYIGEIRAWVPR